jgi:hypothetical protein
MARAVQQRSSAHNDTAGRPTSRARTEPWGGPPFEGNGVTLAPVVQTSATTSWCPLSGGPAGRSGPARRVTHRQPVVLGAGFIALRATLARPPSGVVRQLVGPAGRTSKSRRAAYDRGRRMQDTLVLQSKPSRADDVAKNGCRMVSRAS